MASEWTKAMQTPIGPVVTTMVARFRAVISIQIISVDLQFNPTLQQEEISRAISVNNPKRFLPQPWPPVDVGTLGGLQVAALTKMKALVPIRYGLQSKSSTEIKKHITEKFPTMANIAQQPEHTLIEACTTITEAGDVLFEYHHPEEGHLPIDDFENPGAATIDYVTQMMTLALAQQLEAIDLPS